MSYKQAQKRKRYLLKTYNKTKNSCRGGVYFNKSKSRYVKYSLSDSGSGLTKCLKRISNKKIRKSKDIFNHSNYRKLYDYWWTLY